MTTPVVNKKKRIRTGFCIDGLHEGTRPKTRDGRPVQVCLLWQECPCECHQNITEMYAMAEMPREIGDNPEYKSYTPTYYMPVFGVDYGLGIDARAADGVNGPTTRKVDPDGAFVPREFAPTPSGYAAKGQLEERVLEAVTEWNIDKDPAICTPAWLSAEIARVASIDPPSVGAIGAVFDRWVKYGFAVVERKPVRFVGFTPEGIAKGLDLLKAKYKREH